MLQKSTQLAQTRTYKCAEHHFIVADIEWEFALLYFNQRPEDFKLDRKDVFDNLYLKAIPIGFAEEKGLTFENLRALIQHSFYRMPHSDREDIFAVKGKHHYVNEKLIDKVKNYWLQNKSSFEKKRHLIANFLFIDGVETVDKAEMWQYLRQLNPDKLYEYRTNHCQKILIHCKNKAAAHLTEIAKITTDEENVLARLLQEYYQYTELSFEQVNGSTPKTIQEFKDACDDVHANLLLAAKYHKNKQRFGDTITPSGAFGKFRIGVSYHTGDIVGLKIEAFKHEIQLAKQTEIEITDKALSTLGKSLLFKRQCKPHQFLTQANTMAKWITKLPFIPGSDLLAVLQSTTWQQRPFDYKVIVALNLCIAIEELHRRSIIHYDIKPENCILTPDNRVFLIDYGFAETRENLEPKETTPKGSRVYVSPEVASQKPSGAPADNWSALVVISLMLGLPKNLKQRLLTRAPFVAQYHYQKAQNKPTSLKKDVLMLMDFIRETDRIPKMITDELNLVISADPVNRASLNPLINAFIQYLEPEPPDLTAGSSAPLSTSSAEATDVAQNTTPRP